MSEPQVFNTEAEAQVLGAILMDNDAINKIGEVLQPEHFYAAHNADLYRQIKALIGEGRIASPPLLKSRLSDALYPGGNATAYMMQIFRNPASGIVIVDHARLIADLGIRRKLCETVDGIKYNAVRSDEVPTPKLIDDIDASISDLRASCQQDEARPEAIQDVSKSCIERIGMIQRGEIEPFPGTGLSDLDRHMGGFAPAKMTILAGRPGQGKTIVAAAIARIAAERKEKPYGVAYFSLEVPTGDIWSRMVASKSYGKRYQMSYRSIQEALHLLEDQTEAAIVLGTELGKAPIEIIDVPNMTVSQIKSKVRQIKRNFESRGQALDLVIVDHIGHVKAAKTYSGNMVAEVTEKSGGLLSIAKTEGVHMLALSQLSREVEKRDNKMPWLSDLRDSGSLEQDASNVVMLYRQAYYDEQAGNPTEVPNELTINVAKARDGMTGVFKAYVDPASNFISDMDWRR